MVFNKNIPQPSDLLSKSQQDLLNNNQQLNTTMGIDHYPFDDATSNNGFHKDIHIVKRVGNSGMTTGAYTLFSKDYITDSTIPATDTQLFGITSGGGISQFSGNANQEQGYCWVGGILIQWGLIASPGYTLPNGTVTFKGRPTSLGIATTNTIPFPNALWSVTLTTRGSASSANTLVMIDSTATFDKTQFSYKSLNANGIYWMAIGV